MKIATLLKTMNKFTLEILDEHLNDRRIMSKKDSEEIINNISSELDSNFNDLFKLELGSKIFPDIEPDIFTEFDFSEIGIAPEVDEAYKNLLNEISEFYRKSLINSDN